MSKLSDSESKALHELHSQWPLNLMSEPVRPYGELLRITKPAGVLMFYLPCLYGTFLIGALGYERDFLRLITANFHLLLLSFLLRGALCTWNDIQDRDFDRQVKRTRYRAIARDAVSVPNAYTFLAFQTILIWMYLRSFLPQCWAYARPCMVLHTLYPFAKRFTHHPQLILGFAHANGVFMSFPALGLTIPTSPLSNPDLCSVVSITSGIIFWTLLNDTIYAAQDLVDDKAAGIGSTMIFWEGNARNFLRVLAGLTVGSLLAISFTIGQSSLAGSVTYTLFTCGGTAAGLFVMVENVKLEEPADCGWWFNNGNVLIGLVIASGLIGAYLVR